MDPASLPIQEIRQDFLETMAAPGAACVLSAPTGSGKSTQLPKWLLELLPEGRKILVLQPRRLAARMLSERVAWELGEKAGERVGYVTRYERAVGPNTRVLFVTEGILTRMLLHPRELDSYGCIVFDEFHQRTLDADLGLAMAANLRATTRPDLRLVVMSATLDSRQVVEYLPGSRLLQSKGRCFPVDISYTPRTGFRNLYQAGADALREYLEKGVAGDVLFFLPGVAEIRHAAETLQRTKFPEPLVLMPLYGDMAPEAQHAVMEPAERRKVILATNIAETSLTIPGIRIVIDSGLAKISRYDAQRGINILETQPISDDAAQQRAGRAGREAPGVCRRLWSPLEQDHRTPHGLPEIQRLDLADPILTVHCYGFADDTQFPWFERPQEKAASGARELLTSLGLLLSDGTVSASGQEARKYPTHPRLALMLLLGAQRGAFREACGAAAILEGRPMMLRQGAASTLTQQRNSLRRDRGNRAPGEQPPPESDFLAQLTLLRQAKECHFADDACSRLGVLSGAAREIYRSWQDLLRLTPKNDYAPAQNPALELSRILLECFPDRLARRLDRGTLNCELAQRKRAVLSPQSLVRDEPLLVAGELRAVSAGNTPGMTTELSLVSGVREEWLWELFPDSLKEEDALLWDGVRQQVIHRRTLSCLGVVLEESVRPDADPERASQLLYEQVASTNNMPLLGWDESCQEWIDRVQFLREHFPQLGLPEYSDEECDGVRRELCQGETKYSAVRNKPALPYLQALLTPQQLVEVQRLAPPFLPLPRNRKLRLEYHPGQPPKGRAKIQELYDVTGPVTVGNGKIPVLLDILAPNFRTVQITDDLPRFWNVHYPSIKSQLQRRYPKHEWR